MFAKRGQIDFLPPDWEMRIINAIFVQACAVGSYLPLRPRTATFDCFALRSLLRRPHNAPPRRRPWPMSATGTQYRSRNTEGFEISWEHAGSCPDSITGRPRQRTRLTDCCVCSRGCNAALRRDELIPAFHHVMVFVHNRIPAGDIADPIFK